MLHAETLTLARIAIILIILITFRSCHVALAQSDIGFTPADEFSVPSSNGVINFDVNGTYTRASLVNGTWNFANLRLENSQPLENLMVGAQNSKVTITSYRRFNVSIDVAFLRYVAEGKGKQTFNIGLDPTDGEWSIIFDDVFMSEGEGWTASPEGTLTITVENANVTIAYFGFPNPLKENQNSNQPLIQHSVAIATAVTLAIVVTLTLAIRRRQKTLGKAGVT